MWRALPVLMFLVVALADIDVMHTPDGGLRVDVRPTNNHHYPVLKRVTLCYVAGNVPNCTQIVRQGNVIPACRDFAAIRLGRSLLVSKEATKDNMQVRVVAEMHTPEGRTVDTIDTTVLYRRPIRETSEAVVHVESTDSFDTKLFVVPLILVTTTLVVVGMGILLTRRAKKSSRSNYRRVQALGADTERVAVKAGLLTQVTYGE